MHTVIQDSLDDLTSTRSSISRKARALNALEALIAETYVPRDPSALHTFIASQDSFQYNIPSRLLTWVVATSSRIEALADAQNDLLAKEDTVEIITLAAQLVQALNIVQGVALSHSDTKRYLSRRYALEILVNLLYVARRIPSTGKPIPRSVSTPSPTGKDTMSLPKDATPQVAAAVLDTLSCVLVDAPPALRAFEEAGGVRAVVKVLKRQGTPRDVKIKCMEFLYFYVNAENPVWTQRSPSLSSPSSVSSSSTAVAVSDPAPVHHSSSSSSKTQTDHFDFLRTAPNSPTAGVFTPTASSSTFSMPASPAVMSTPPNAMSTPPRRLTPRLVRSDSGSSTCISSNPGATQPPVPASSGDVPTAKATPPPVTPHSSRIRSLSRQASGSSAVAPTAASGSAQPLLSTPKKAPATPYPRTPRKALKPLNLGAAPGASGRRLSREVAFATPGLESAPPPPGLRGHRRAQTQVEVDVSPPQRDHAPVQAPGRERERVSALVSGTRPAFAQGHRRASSLLNAHSPGNAGSSSPQPLPRMPPLAETESQAPAEASTRPALSHKRASTQLNIDIRTGAGAGSSPPQERAVEHDLRRTNTDTPSVQGPAERANRPGHRRARSSLDARTPPPAAPLPRPPHTPFAPRTPPALAHRDPTAWAHTPTTRPHGPAAPLSTPHTPAAHREHHAHARVPDTPIHAAHRREGEEGVQTRTREEKTEILRGMMSNVDALLEGMSRVGIWGL